MLPGNGGSTYNHTSGNSSDEGKPANEDQSTKQLQPQGNHTKEVSLFLEGRHAFPGDGSTGSATGGHDDGDIHIGQNGCTASSGIHDWGDGSAVGGGKVFEKPTRD